MAKRRTLSQRTRFEVFKRDRFTCQYCGNTPPTVVLEIDHILAVANGGNNDEGNLLTSCKDCNAGKSDKPLSEAPESLAKQIEDRKERAIQIEAYNAFLLELRQQEDKQIRELGLYWFNKFRSDKNAYVFGHSRVTSVRTFLQGLPFVAILDSIDKAHWRVPVHGDYDGKTWKYFCGICWRKIKGDGNYPDREL